MILKKIISDVLPITEKEMYFLFLQVFIQSVNRNFSEAGLERGFHELQIQKNP